MTDNRPIILVLIGITGNLARRKILPAIEKIAAAGILPEQFKVVGISRREISTQEVLRELPKPAYLSQHLSMYRMDLEDPADYIFLAGHLQELESQLGAEAQRIFYLSVPPQTAKPIITLMGESELSGGHSQLLLEKPFGWDIESAQELIAETNRHFKEEQVYRIDHYLAKEMAQNLLVFRQGNPLIDRTWDKEFIERVEVIVSEKIGIEGRTVLYEQTGALRDIVQSHLLQMAALTLMELPKSDDWDKVPDLRLAALRQLVPPTADEVPKQVLRGQYVGYREEVGNPASNVETFVSLTINSADPRWQGIPLQLITGKSLNRRAAEIRLYYRHEPHQAANQLVIRLNPPEGIELCLWSKKPGYDRELQEVKLDFTFDQHDMVLPEAHEQVILNAIRGDHSLFTSSEEVLASWHILAPIQQAWQADGPALVQYAAGSTPEQVITGKS